MSLLNGSTEGQPVPEQQAQPGGNPVPEQQQQSDWRSGLPDDLKSNPTLSKFKDIPSLAKSYIHAQGMIGKSGIVPPTEKSSDEEWNHFYNSIGRPPIDKYDIKAPEGIKAESLKNFKQWAHEAGLLPKQAEAIFNKYLDSEKNSISQFNSMREKQTQEQVEGLKKEWGDGFTKNVALAKLAVKELGGDEFGTYLETSGLGNDTKLIRYLSKVGKLLGEDKIRGQADGNYGKTPAEIQESIGAIMGNMQHPYHDSSHPGHRAAVSQMEELFKKSV